MNRNKVDAIKIELNGLRKDLGSLSPKVSTYSKIKGRIKELEEKLSKII